MDAPRPAWQTDELQEEWVEDGFETGSDEDYDLTYGTRSVSFTTPLQSIQQSPNDAETAPVPENNFGTFLVREDVENAPLFPKAPGRRKEPISTFFTPSKLERMFEPPTPPLPNLPTIPDASPSAPSHPETETDAAPTGPFTFTVPHRRLASLEGSAAGAPVAQSTPKPPPGPKTVPQNDQTPLRLFQFNYDTYTRDHLSAMVDSIAGHTPATGSSNSQPTSGQRLSLVEEASTSHLRSTKRVKLSPQDDYYGEGDGAGARIFRPKTGKDYVGASQSLMQQIRKKAMDTSTMSTVISTHRTHDEGGASQHADSTSSTPSFEKRSSFLGVPSNSSHTNPTSATSTLSSKPSNSSALTYRQRGADLLEQIRNDMKGQKRVFSGETDVSIVTAHRDEKENRCDQSPHRHRKSFSRSSSLKSLPRRMPQSQPVFSQQPIQVFAMTVTEDNNHLVPQPAISGNDGSVPPRSAPATQTQLGRILPASRQPNEDLHRFVSSSTTASATLTTGSAGSFIKQAGPPHLRTIAPTDIPELPQKLGNMMFDRVMMKWVKSSSNDLHNVLQEPVTEEDPSDDPFGDIESLRDETGVHNPVRASVPQDALDELRQSSGESAPASPREEQSPEIGSIESEDDEDDMDLSSFSTDGQSMRIVHVMTGDDDITDSDADDVVEVITQTEGFDSTFSSDDDALPQDFDAPSISPESPPTSPPQSPPPEEDLAVTETLTPRRETQGPPATPIVRSALKNQNGTATPVALGRGREQTPYYSGSRHRRSVSFSDGKRDGPIRGLNGRRDEPPRPPMDSLTFVPSARSKRIADMMNDLENDPDGTEDDSPSKGSGRATKENSRSQRLSPREEWRGEVSIPHNTSTSRKRVLSRSQSFRSSGGPGNATFLTECSFGVAHDRLVEVITDVQPFEPHWEDLSSIDLSQKNIESVARLKEFLPRLEVLSLNSNQISWLSGVPGSLRTLSVASNNLSAVTSFNHLLKLECLDISHNGLDSLSQLSCLRRLRELRADGNQITGIDGLQGLERLTKLSLQRNKIREIDIEGCWPKLEVLGLSSNLIDDITGLESLISLISLNLENNRLATLRILSPLKQLRILRISANRLQDLEDVLLHCRAPNLRTLYLDENLMRSTLSGATVRRAGFRKVENLSMRHQKSTIPGGNRRREQELLNAFSLTSDLRDVKRLYLSGNPLSQSTTLLSKPAYNLTYLELASCRLTALPFTSSAPIGTVAPNLRVLNLNYNFLDDAALLAGVLKKTAPTGQGRLERLKRLSVVGSRVQNVRTIVKVLEGLTGNEMEMVDFRMNPCTLAWYLPLMVREVPGSAEHSRPANQEHGPDVNPQQCVASPTSDYKALDAQFRRSLPDSTYVGRLAYRGLVMRSCEGIKEIDGVEVKEKEKVKAERLLERIGR